MAIDTFNKFGVGAIGDKLTIMFPHKVQNMTYDDALSLAATLKLMAEPFAQHKFDEYEKAMRNS